MSRLSRHAVAADVVFNGERRHDNVAVVIEDRQIAALTPRGDLPSSIAVYNAPRGAWLAPGFIDIQVNGGGDVLFNADPCRPLSRKLPRRTASSA
jgi:N-acetylglucosamine-6-phosphate deacetylase